MVILKSSPAELAIHGGGPPAFASRVPAFRPHVGNGQRFGQLAERMFGADEVQGRMVEEFEALVAQWLSVRNVIGFSSLHAATRTLAKSQRPGQHVLIPSFGSTAFPLEEDVLCVESEPGTYGLCPNALSGQIREKVQAVFAINLLGRPCQIQELEDVCDEWNLPLFLYGHQALGCRYRRELLGGFGNAEVFDLGRDQLIHATDAAIVTTDDDLLAHRLRNFRATRPDGVDQAMGDAAAAMGIANLESVDAFLEENRVRYELYSEYLAEVPGMRLVTHETGSTYQSIAIEVDPRLCGITRNSLHDVLAAENVGTAKPLEGSAIVSTPIAYRLDANLLQLPMAATEQAIEAICKLIELAVVRSLESPDPIRLVA